MPAPLPHNEEQRLAALHSYGILDTASEPAFDDIARLVADICDVPVALVALLDDKRQWFKAKIGVELAEAPRDLAFCGHTILDDGVLEVSDAALDTRFADNPLVIGDPRVRFYAGAPLHNGDGLNIGTLCVLDSKPRRLTERQKAHLQALARQVMAQLELRRALADKERALQQKDILLKEVNHRVKNGLQMIASLMQLQKRRIVDPIAQQQISDMGTRIQTLATVHRHLYRHDDLDTAELVGYLREVCRPLAQSADVAIEVEAPAVPLPVDALVPLAMIVSELVTNSAKYGRVAPDGQKDGQRGRRPVVRVTGALLDADPASPAAPGAADAADRGRTLRLTVSDDGPGLPPGFDPEHSSGLGMKVVTSLVQQLDGTLTATPGPGARFDIEVKMKMAERG